ncbi:MAG: hypothetical protein IKS15_03190 [Opitutales bacterium]|nr:hypothetical protein [Opitutales bacterium]
MKIFAAVFFALAFACNLFAGFESPRAEAESGARMLLRGFCAQDPTPQINPQGGCRTFAAAKRSPLPDTEPGRGKDVLRGRAEIFPFSAFCRKPARAAKNAEKIFSLPRDAHGDFQASYSVFLI